MAGALEALDGGRLGNDSKRAAIRRFFLEPRAAYSLPELAALWEAPIEDVRAIFSEELGESGCFDETLVGWAEALGASLAYHVFRPYEIECALGDEFARVRPEMWRTEAVTLRLPLWLAERLRSEPVLPSTLDLAGRIERMLLLAYQPGT